MTGRLSVASRRRRRNPCRVVLFLSMWYHRFCSSPDLVVLTLVLCFDFIRRDLQIF